MILTNTVFHGQNDNDNNQHNHNTNDSTNNIHVDSFCGTWPHEFELRVSGVGHA